MINRYVARRLQAAILIMGFCFLAAFALFAPTIGITLANEFAPWAYMFWPVLITLWVSCIPIAIGLYHAWKICSGIYHGRMFYTKYAFRLKRIAQMATLDGIIYIIGFITLCMKKMINPGLILLTLMVLSLVSAVAIAGDALSHMVQQAAAIRQENEMTV